AGDGRRRDRGCPESGRRGRWPTVRREGWTSRARAGRRFRRATYIEWGCVPTSTSYRYIIYIVSRKKCAGGRWLNVGRPIPWRQVVLSVGVVSVTLWRVSFADLRAAFRDLDSGSLYQAFFCILALMVLRAYKWHRLMVAVGNFRFQQSMRTLLGGCVLGLITPGRVGELGRCIFV